MLIIFQIFIGLVFSYQLDSTSLLEHTTLVDQGPATYKNMSCGHFPWHRQYVCQWTNRVSKESFEIRGREARSMLITLMSQGRQLTCRSGMMGEVCDLYFFRVSCDENICRLRSL